MNTSIPDTTKNQSIAPKNCLKFGSIYFEEYSNAILSWDSISLKCVEMQIHVIPSNYLCKDINVSVKAVFPVMGVNLPNCIVEEIKVELEKPSGEKRLAAILKNASIVKLSYITDGSNLFELQFMVDKVVKVE